VSDIEETVEDNEEAPKYALKVLALTAIATHGVANLFGVVGNVVHAIAFELAAAANYSRYIDELTAEEEEVSSIVSSTNWDDMIARIDPTAELGGE
jgi:hypothetical protein